MVHVNVHRQPKVGVLQSLTLALILIHSPCCIMIFIFHSTVCTFAYAFTFVYAPLLQIRLVPCRPKVGVPLLEQGIYAFSLYTFTECSDSCGWQWWRGEISVRIFTKSWTNWATSLNLHTYIRTYVQIIFSVLVYLIGLTTSHYLLVISTPLAANRCLSGKSVSCTGFRYIMCASLTDQSRLVRG